MEDDRQYVERLGRQAFAELALITAGKKPYLRPKQWQPVEYAARAPVSGVTLDGGPLRTCFDRNVAYLNDWFEKKQGWRTGFDEKNWWESDLPASSEGRMIAAAAHTLRWGERADMRRIVDVIVGAVKARQRPDGYCLPYDEQFMNACPKPGQDERRNYDRVNLTRGMVAAALVGNRDALPVMRRFYDWLYASAYCATLLAGHFYGPSSKVNDTAGPPGAGTAHNCNNGHDGSLCMYFSPAGKPQDLVAAERYFVQDFFLEASARREPLSLSHYPYHVAHSYVLLAYKAWLDHYRATGAAKYLDAAKGAWQIVHDHFLHIGGSPAICEHVAGAYPPDSYYLRVDKEHHTGENCGSVFWADINHRFLQFFPDEARYADEIERVIFNATLANQDARGHIRYHSRLQDRKEEARSINTCCEVMGAPFIASLPQYVFSIADDGLYVNLYAPSTIAWKHGGRPVTLTQATDFPFRGQVALKLGAPSPVAMKLRLRVPGWSGGQVKIAVNGAAAVTGVPGSYAVLDRAWKTGDTVTFELPMEFRTERYAGADQDPKYARNALLYGPLLMALTGATDLEIPVAELPGRLKPIAAKPLHFTVAGAPAAQYLPYWLITDEAFTCFPTTR